MVVFDPWYEISDTPEPPSRDSFRMVSSGTFRLGGSSDWISGPKMFRPMEERLPP